MKIGSEIQLTQRERNTIEKVMARFAGEIGTVKVYGSRARGNARRNSDIDLVVYPPIRSSQMARLIDAFEESDLPFSVDLTSWESIESGALKTAIEEHAVPLLERMR